MIVQPPINRPVPKFRQKVGLIVLETRASLPIICKQQADCPCTVTKTFQTTTIDYVAKSPVNRIGLGARLTAASYVIWQAGCLLQPNTADCHTGKLIGVILGMLHSHGAHVIDPNRMQLGWLLAHAGPDNDGRSNIRELAEGFDPFKAD